MGKGGTIAPGPPGHRSLHFEVIQKTLAAGTATITASTDLEMIDDIKHVFPIVELTHTSTTSLLATAVGVKIAAAGATAEVYVYKGVVLDVSCLVLGY
jgi:hypothetical protein